jgi:hypothetical protein
LGEWGDETAAAALCRLLRAEKDEEVRLYCITALRLIGGLTAAEGLREAVESGTEAVRNAALTAVEELATGGRRDDTEGPDVPAAPPVTADTSKGILRMKGAPRVRGEQILGRIADTLRRIRRDDKVSAFLRRKADEVLSHLQPR